jgi:DNA-binding IclR family transcriptional regulator
MIGSAVAETDARRLVLSTMERGGSDGWTTDRLAARLGLPLGTVARAMVDLTKAGFVSRLDDEWFSTVHLDY